MYPFVSHTWNPVKGKCFHDCSYCYMKRWGAQRPLRLDEKDLETNLGRGNVIFVGSSCDLFAADVDFNDVERVLRRCALFDNQYLFQTKNPANFYPYGFNGLFPAKSAYCLTLETNRHTRDIMGAAPAPELRAEAFASLDPPRKMITVEPVMDFDPDRFIALIKACKPYQVNIGADSGGHHLPEPSGEKIKRLIEELRSFTSVVPKTNLARLTA